MEFVIVREEFSDDEEVKPEIGTVKPITAQSPEESTAGSSQADYEVSLRSVYIKYMYVVHSWACGIQELRFCSGLRNLCHLILCSVIHLIVILGLVEHFESL